MHDWDALILGAGAAGLICGAEAARRGRRVLVVEHNPAPGEKIRISGGGRCNFTNLHAGPDRYLSENPRFAISALSRFTQADFVARVTARGIAWHEKGRGELFCDGSARQIVTMLTDDLAQAGGTLRLGLPVTGVEPAADGGFVVETGAGPVTAARLVVATGGKSIPKMGASGLGYRIAERFGIRVTPTRAGLVPLTFAPQDLAGIAPLSGLSAEARVSVPAPAPGQRDTARPGPAFDGPLLFTHRGLSGPAILQISSYWREGQPLHVNLHPAGDLAALLRAQRGANGRIAVTTALARHLPERLAAAIVAETGLTGTLADQGNAALDRLAAATCARVLRPAGSEGYRTAEVTLGGVDTAALDARTLAARTVPGLHFVGEVDDVTCWLGGYNFQWAWSSGWAAGQAL